jgi:hypothetical protein
MSTLSMRIGTYLIKYLSEFEFIFKTVLDYKSGDQMGSFDAKNPASKISCLGTFNYALLVNSALGQNCIHISTFNVTLG